MIDYSLYVITDRHLQGSRTTSWVIEEVIRGGATVVQLREKGISTRDYFKSALLIRQVTKNAGLPLIINDRVDIALAVGADGVHLGDEDLPLVSVRRIAPNLIIGYSADSIDTALQAEKEGADYLGVGSVFATTTKPDAGSSIGIPQLGEIKKAVSIPVVAIGGITIDHLLEVMNTGVDGVAVISAIVAAPSPATATRGFRVGIDSYRKRMPCQP